MTTNTTELKGIALDWAVAKCEGLTVETPGELRGYSPSNDWSQGGPIIERENIDIVKMHSKGWRADCCGPARTGPTPLIAAMRSYVAKKLGENINVPNTTQSNKGIEKP